MCAGLTITYSSLGDALTYPLPVPRRTTSSVSPPELDTPAFPPSHSGTRGEQLLSQHGGAGRDPAQEGPADGT